MKNKVIILAGLSGTLLLAGCGQSGPLYLSAPSDASTTSGIHQQHINTNEGKPPAKQHSVQSDTASKESATSATVPVNNAAAKQPDTNDA